MPGNGRGARGAFGQPGIVSIPQAAGSFGVSTPAAPLDNPDVRQGAAPTLWDATLGAYQSGMTVGVWESDASAAMALYGPTYGAVRAVFQSPLFDLRGDFGTQNAPASGAYRVPKEVMLGNKYRLHMDIDADFTNAGGPLDVNGASAYAWYYIEFGHTQQPKVALNTDVIPNLPRFFTSRQNITGDVLAGYQPTTDRRQATLRWVPDGNLRYWGVALVVDYVGDPDGPLAYAGIKVSMSLH